METLGRGIDAGLLDEFRISVRLLPENCCAFYSDESGEEDSAEVLMKLLER